MNTRLRLILLLSETVLLAFLVALSASCGGGGGGSASPSSVSSVQAVACTGTIAATVEAVGITSWNPALVAISVNDVVLWKNETGVTHTVTGTTVPANGNFDAALPDNASVCFKFTSAGTFNYRCSIHPVMTGSIVVN